jgi:hypothetical protein
MSDFDPWDRLDEARRAIYEKGEAAAQVLQKYETIERWHEIGDAAAALMADAMTWGGSNTATGRGYNHAWARLSAHCPTVRDLDKSARSAAVWMAQNWTQVSVWLNTLTPSERLKLNHPTVIHRRYDAAHKPPSPEGTAAAVSPRIAAQDELIKVQRELDMLRKKGGGGLLPGASVEEVVEAIFTAQSPAFVKKLIMELDKRLEAEVRQDAIEAKAAKLARRAS